MEGKTNSGAGEMAPLTKCLSCQGKDLSSFPQISLKKQGMEACMHDSRKGEMGGRGSWMPGAIWPCSLV